MQRITYERHTKTECNCVLLQTRMTPTKNETSTCSSFSPNSKSLHTAHQRAHTDTRKVEMKIKININCSVGLRCAVDTEIKSIGLCSTHTTHTSTSTRHTFRSVATRKMTNLLMFSVQFELWTATTTHDKCTMCHAARVCVCYLFTSNWGERREMFVKRLTRDERWLRNDVLVRVESSIFIFVTHFLCNCKNNRRRTTSERNDARRWIAEAAADHWKLKCSRASVKCEWIRQGIDTLDTRYVFGQSDLTRFAKYFLRLLFVRHVPSEWCIALNSRGSKHQ